MLKITVHETPGNFRVNLSGQFTGEYIPEIDKLLSPPHAASRALALDLGNVTFVDREAMLFLCRAKSGRISIENIPTYVTRWIEQEGRCRSD